MLNFPAKRDEIEDDLLAEVNEECEESGIAEKQIQETGPSTTGKFKSTDLL